MIHLYTQQTNLAALVSAVPSRNADTEATLSVADGHATLSTVTDGGAARARIRRAVDVQRPGDVVVSAAVLRDAVRGLPKGGNVEVRQNAHKLTLYAGGSRTTIPVIPDAPPSWWTPPQPDGAWRFAADPLVSALRRVRPSVAVEDVRWGFNGLLVQNDNGVARFTATDRHRLHTATAAALEVGALPAQTLIPPAAIVGIEAAAVGEVSLLIEAGAVTLWTGDDVLSWATVDGEFPDWRQVVPGEYPTRIIARAGELSNALKRHINGAARVTRAEFSHDALTLTTAHDVVEVADTVAIELDGPVPRDVGMNARYMVEAIAAFSEGDFVTFTARDIGTAFRVCETIEHPDFGLVMPMRLS